MTILSAYTLGTDGLSLSVYSIDLATGAESAPRFETFRNAKARRSRAATLSETHVNSARIVRHPGDAAVCFLVREPALDEWALYFRGEFAGYVMGWRAAEDALDAMVTDWLEARAAERDADEDRAALHPRYVRQGGDVYDTNAGRWYCTVASWQYSPAARDGAVLGEQARKAA